MPSNSNHLPVAPRHDRTAVTWITEAVINWLTGLVLGLATAACIVFLSSRVFPELEDFGVDLGMRVDGGKRSRYAATPVAV